MIDGSGMQRRRARGSGGLSPDCGKMEVKSGPTTWGFLRGAQGTDFDAEGPDRETPGDIDGLEEEAREEEEARRKANAHGEKKELPSVRFGRLGLDSTPGRHTRPR